MTTDGVLREIDEALLRLRRLWTAPAPDLVVEDVEDGAPVTMSSVLVVEACAQGLGEVAVGDVARFLDVEHSTASRLVDRAVRGGFVARGGSGRDARRVTLTLTPSGQALRERAVGFRTRRLAAVVAGWRRGDVATFARLLARFADDSTGAHRTP